MSQVTPSTALWNTYTARLACCLLSSQHPQQALTPGPLRWLWPCPAHVPQTPCGFQVFAQLSPSPAASLNDLQFSAAPGSPLLTPFPLLCPAPPTPSGSTCTTGSTSALEGRDFYLICGELWYTTDAQHSR